MKIFEYKPTSQYNCKKVFISERVVSIDESVVTVQRIVWRKEVEKKVVKKKISR